MSYFMAVSLLSIIMLLFAIERLMRVFFDERRVRISIAILPYLFYFVYAALAFLFLDVLPAVVILAGIVPVFVITLNYKSTMFKRLVMAVLCTVIFSVASLLVMAFFAINLNSMFGGVSSLDALGVVIGSLLAFFLALLIQNLKNMKSNIVVSPITWISILLIPLSSIVLCIMIFALTNLNDFALTIIVAIMLGINLLTFYSKGSLSATYEGKLESALRMQAMIDSSPLACAIIDKNHDIIETNDRIVNLFELSSEEDYIQRQEDLSPKYQADGTLSHVKSLEIIDQAFETGHAHCEWMHCTLDGDIIPCELTLVRVYLSGKTLVIRYIHDLRQLASLGKMQNQLEILAFTDGLTSLFNRAYFMDVAETKLQYCNKNEQPFSVVMIDLDHFKRVNDKYGHTIGDKVLNIFAKRIKHVLRDDSIVARYGGEEFAIVLPGIDAKYAAKTARRIQDNIIKLPFIMDDASIPVTASFGVATHEGGDASLLNIINKAEAAVLQAKKQGRNTVVSRS